LRQRQVEIGLGLGLVRLGLGLHLVGSHDVDGDRLSRHRAERMYLGQKKHQTQHRQMRDRRCRDVRAYELPNSHRSRPISLYRPRSIIAVVAVQPQSHFGAKLKSVIRPLAFARLEISPISASESAKSKISMFSDSRSMRDVRGIADTFC